jgi:hypothetical protein
MEQIFYVRTKGRVRKMLAVLTDGEQYRLEFTVIGRTEITKSERLAGVKSKNVEKLNKVFEVPCTERLDPASFPIPELVQKFISSLQKEHKHDN